MALLLAGTAASYAAIPAGALNDPLYAKGYIVVYPHYAGVYNNAPSDPVKIASTTAGLQTAIEDARASNRVLYLPSGTYMIEDTLKAWVQTREKPGFVNKNIVIVGSTIGYRPIIRLKPNANGFGDIANPKVMLEFRNFPAEDSNGNPIALPTTIATEKPNAGYGQMLRGVMLDCNNASGTPTTGNCGAVGLYFNHAQDSSIENVRVIATNAIAGIWGIPARAWGAVNIEVEGGKYGIDTTPWPGVQSAGNIGSVIAGAKLTNQTVSAIRHPGQALTVVGFEIVTPAGSTPAITIGGNSVNDTAQSSCLNLIDGKITLTSALSGGVAVSNPYERTIYLRNVYVTGGNNLVQTGTHAPITGSGTWKRIDEYSYCNQGAAATVGRETWDVLNGAPDRNPTFGPVPPQSGVSSGLGNGEIRTISNNTPVAPTDFIARHIWSALPTVDDTDYYDPVGAGAISPGTVSASTLQGIINNHRKIFLRPGVYRLTNPIFLKSNTILFGAARPSTKIEVAPPANWGSPAGTPVTGEVSLITAVSDASATTYLGDISIGVPTDNNVNGTSRDYFTALDWQAGANSMVHISRPYHNPQPPTLTDLTNAHSLIKIRNSGGGRWYFLGRGQSRAMQHTNYRILKVSGTSQPLWIYGLNMEHARSDKFAEFVNASNIRIYCVKTEFAGEFSPPIFRNSTLLSFSNVQNAAMFGHSAIRHAPNNGYNIVEFKGTSARVLATLIVPQNNDPIANPGKLLYESITGQPVVSHAYPNGVALYKRGAITTADEAAMRHANIGYAPLPAGWANQDIGPVGEAGSAFHGSGTFTLNGSGADIWGSTDEFHFAYQTLSGDRTITARVATQENTAAFAKAGVMIRAELEPTSKFVNMHVTPTSGTRFHYRTAPPGTVQSVTGPSGQAPYWVRVKRTGNTFIGYTSVNGTSWTQVGSITISGMPSVAYVGLMGCSVNDGVINTATFDSVTITQP